MKRREEIVALSFGERLRERAEVGLWLLAIGFLVALMVVVTLVEVPAAFLVEVACGRRKEV